MKKEMNQTLGCVLFLIIMVITPFLSVNFLQKTVCDIILCIALICQAIYYTQTFPKQRLQTINKKMGIPILFVCIAYVLILYVAGFWMGFQKNPYAVHNASIRTHVMLCICAIICTEVMRKHCTTNFMRIIAYIESLVLSMYLFQQFEKVFMKTQNISQILLCITIAILFCYISLRITYVAISCRLFVELWILCLPVIPNIPEVLGYLCGLLVALVVILLLNRKSLIYYIIIPCITVWCMFLSCEFFMGGLIIATESMTGTLNKGTFIVYESQQTYQVNDIIVFEKPQQGYKTVVHRIVQIDDFGDDKRFYTKGDFNETQDSGYIQEQDIKGKVIWDIPYLGYPNIWINTILKGGR